MHEEDAKGILSAQNGMNIYRGCTHGCIYCDARSTCYQMDHAFEDIEVKRNAPELLEKYMLYFVLPAFVLFWIFFLVLVITQIRAFTKGLTPYPKWCWVFCLPVGMAAAMLLNVFGNHPLVNAISCAWISVGNLWMFGGLLAMMKKVRA